MSRDLTELEKQFVAEAQDNYFGVLIDEDDGHPYAMGARGCDNLFSMDVEEKDDAYNGGSIYTLPKRDRPAPAHQESQS